MNDGSYLDFDGSAFVVSVYFVKFSNFNFVNLCSLIVLFKRVWMILSGYVKRQIMIRCRLES